MFGREPGKKFAITGKQEEHPATHDLVQPANTLEIQIQDKFDTNTRQIQ